ncbi:MAG TPA: hypothetical protein VGR51_09470 [Thermoplasmata archaeon]|nr:hypothetical protein [Thermoplasmata archaeon]
MTQEYRKEIDERLATFLTRFTDADLQSYLATRSRLPGPRANLELAAAFAASVGDQKKEWKAMWALASRLTAIPPEEAPTNDPREFVVFCGTRAIGALGVPSAARAREALVHLRTLARDPRWRVREGVAIAIQDIAEGQPAAAVRELEDWMAPGAWLEMRAVAAGLAEPRILKDAKIARAALETHERILKRLAAAKERESAGFRSLRQCLSYSLSVVVVAAPEGGFRLLTRFASSSDPDVVWIIKENLKKGRLAGAFAGRVERLQATMRRG